MQIKNWLTDNLLDFTFIEDNIFEIKDVGKFLVLSEKEQVFDEFMYLVLTEEEDIECDYFCFLFGSNYYYSATKKISEFNILKYLGKAVPYEDFPELPFLGIHGGFDILNGSRSYTEWCKKANFLGVDVLGICELNTLAGILKFQISCFKNNILPIMGAQYTVRDGDKVDKIKCYVKNEEGWRNILLINTEVNVKNNGFITRQRFFELIEGLVIIIDPKYTDFKEVLAYDLHIDDLYWQIDGVEFENNNKDKDYLLNVKQYINSEYKPVLITDAYYLDKDEHTAKELLNNISDNRDFKSINQYFKPIRDVLSDFNDLFTSDEGFINLIEKASENLLDVVEKSKFNVNLKEKHFPEYVLTTEEEKKYGTKEDMFLKLIEHGVTEKLCDVDDLDEYFERIDTEYDVISSKGYVDYFLILWDIINWSRENGILVGVGRGSSAGSLIAYLLDIVRIDPLKFGLLFERFLNIGRTGAVDIDTDFQGERREEVKHYMERRYGAKRVCSVGTYTNLKLKQAFKDVSRQYGVTFGTANDISQIFDSEEGMWVDIFKTAVQKKKVRSFIESNPEVIQDMRLVLNQPKSRSVHACATIILPNNRDLYTTIPVRVESKNEESFIVSEWEGTELEIAGYLKEDILGIKQLDKYALILDLIKKNTGKEIDIYNLPLDDRSVIILFQEGMTGDIYHFGTRGLTTYCKQLKPENINDLIAAISLFRPGAMDVNSHNEYVLRKTGEKPVKYKFMMNTITKNTYGLLVYQEQVMKVFQVLADFTLSEADDVRRAIGKKKKEILEDKKIIFVNKCKEKGCSKEEALEIWHDVEVHAGYSFNLSHAAATAVTGYIGQWLKRYYPLEFWTSAFQYDNEDPKKSNLNRYITEIRRTSAIKLRPPHINESGVTFTSNPDKKEIYWSLGRVKQVGEKALEEIIKTRQADGEFYSLKEFIDRINTRVVNKAVVINLILSGAFDDMTEIKEVEERINIIKQYDELRKTESHKEYTGKDKIFWQLKQKELCGYGEIDYEYVIKQKTDLKGTYIDGFDLQDPDTEGKNYVIAGVIMRIIERTSKKTGEYAQVELDSNNTTIVVTLWSDIYESAKESLEVGGVIALNGKVRYDSYKDIYAVQSTKTTKLAVI